MFAVISLSACNEVHQSGETGGTLGSAGIGGDGGFDLSECADDPFSSSPVRMVDYSGFGSFSFFREEAACDFDFSFDEVFSADINKTASGEYSFAYSMLIEGAEDAPSCFLSPPCWVLHESEPRALSAVEAAELVDEFGSVGVSTKYVCDCSIDPCTINRFNWDGHAHSDWACERQSVGYSSRTGIIKLLSNFAMVGDR